MDIDTLLREAHPTPDITPVKSGLDDLLASLVAGPEPRRRHRRLAVGLVAGLTALGLGMGGLAVAGTFTTRTGVHGLPGMTENDTSEYLRNDSPDFIPYARSITQDIEFAPGYSPEPYWHFLTRPNPDGGPETLYQATGVRGDVAGWAACSWEWTWQGAVARGDTGAATTAVAALYRAADARIMHQINNATWTRQLADAAATGDPQGFLANDVRVNCDGLKR